MQLFTCPFCGPRAETEFHYAGDYGNLRPEGFKSVSDDVWSLYLFGHKNERGVTREIWKHLPCMEVFAMTRDSLSHQVLATDALLGEG